MRAKGKSWYGPRQIQINYSHHISERGRIFKVLDKILRNCNSEGFIITITHTDNNFIPLMDKFKYELYTTMNYTKSGDHDPEI